MIFLNQGAEGIIYQGTYLTKNAIIKERISKKYRVPELDAKINKQRILQEVRCMVKCRKNGVLSPAIYLVDLEQRRIIMEHIDGITLKQYLYNIYDISIALPIVKAIGVIIGRIHEVDTVHGDLTTSNIMIKFDVINNNTTRTTTTTTSNTYQLSETSPTVELTPSINISDIYNSGITSNANALSTIDANISSTSNASISSAAAIESTTTTSSLFSNIVIIDFGLSSMQANVEDKAVDLYVLERAFTSTHPNTESLVSALLESYRTSYRKSTTILEKLDQVRLRGRKRDMFG